MHVSVDLVDGNSAVQIEAENWAIRGSDLIEKLNLNRRFSLAFTARLSWTPAASAAATGGSVQTANGNGAVVAPSGTGEIQCRTSRPGCHAGLPRIVSWVVLVHASGLHAGLSSTSSILAKGLCFSGSVLCSDSDTTLCRCIVQHHQRRVTSGRECFVESAGKVHGSLDLDVWSEVIGPFRFLPRGVLESTGNTVLTTLVSSLLPPFLKR